MDRLSGRFSPLQGDVNQAAIVDNSGCVDQFASAPKGCFANCDLVFVHISNHGIGVPNLSDLTEKFIGIPLINTQHGAFRIICCRGKV